MNIYFTPLIPSAVQQQVTDITLTGDTTAFTLSIQDMDFSVSALPSSGGTDSNNQKISISLSLSL